MQSKIERAAPRTSQRPSGVDLPVSTAKAEAVSPSASQPLAVPRDLSEAANAALKPIGDQVATSADPGQLWGASPREEAVAQFRSMNPADRQQRLEEVKQEREEVRGQINTRCDDLDRRWQHMPPHAQAQALGEYERHSRQMDPETHRELRRLLHQADQHHEAVESLQQRVQELGTSKADKHEKTELKKEIKVAEKAEKATVQQAVKTVDDKGLRLDRLAETEKIIDPSSTGPSLLSLIDKFVDFSWLVDTFTELIKQNPKDEQDKHDLKVAAERLEYDIRQDRVKKHRALDDLNKDDRTEEQRRAAMGHTVARGRSNAGQ